MSQERKINDVQRLDPNMQLQGPNSQDWQWLSPFQEPFQLSGFPWIANEKIFRRLPKNPQWPLPPNVDVLANCTAGGQVRFSTNSPRLAVRVRLEAPASLYHMPSTGECGFDCYVGEPGEMRYLSTTRYDHKETEYLARLFNTENVDRKHITLNFPLYQGVSELSIGIEPSAKVFSPTPYKDKERVVFYGTSITQGGCASRPGMAFTNILSRRFEREFVNLGFSGNGKGEPELAHIINEIPDVACYVLDYDANVASAEATQETLPEFIRILRKDHPTTPIVVLPKLPGAAELYHKEVLEKRLRKAKIQRDTVQLLQSQGDENLSHFNILEAIDDDYLEATVDGTHPTDLGFWMTANALEPMLKKILS